MTDAIERLAQAMIDALEPEDAASYIDDKSIESVVMDGRFDFVAAVRKLIEARLVAPAPLYEIRAETKFGEMHRRWATDWERITGQQARALLDAAEKSRDHTD